MVFELRQQFQVESARYLPKLAGDHPCSRMHGHSFKIILRLRGPLDERGWVLDYHEIARRMDPLLRQLDHRILNEVPGLENPTSENLCLWLWERAKPLLPELVQVSVRETSDTECSYPAL